MLNRKEGGGGRELDTRNWEGGVSGAKCLGGGGGGGWLTLSPVTLVYNMVPMGMALKGEEMCDKNISTYFVVYSASKKLSSFYLCFTCSTIISACKLTLKPKFINNKGY